MLYIKVDSLGCDFKYNANYLFPNLWVWFGGSDCEFICFAYSAITVLFIYDCYNYLYIANLSYITCLLKNRFHTFLFNKLDALEIKSNN